LRHRVVSKSGPGKVPDQPYSEASSRAEASSLANQQTGRSGCVAEAAPAVIEHVGGTRTGVRAAWLCLVSGFALEGRPAPPINLSMKSPALCGLVTREGAHKGENRQEMATCSS